MSHFKWATFALIALTSLSTTAFAETVPMNMLAKREPMSDPSAAPVANESMTLVEIVRANPSLSTLNKALDSAGLAQTLQGEGPFTIFAPNDMAFAKLSPNVLADLMRPENKDKLAAIISYHILPGQISASDVKNGQANTLNGKNLNFKVDKGTITIGNAKVIKTDLVGSNGTIHIIDTVLMPQ